MGNYVLILRQNGGFRIGRKRYSKAEAIKRVEALRLIGINMEVMLEQETFSSK